MANKTNKDAFNRLKKLTPKKRLQMFNSSVGQSYLGLLTPTQFAELFPRYYERNYPDIGGFRKAISKMSAEKQQKYADSVERRLGEVGAVGMPSGVEPGKGGRYSPAQMAQLIRQAGGTEEEARTLGAIAMAESKGNPGVTNMVGRDNSYGLWQINLHPETNPAQRMRLLGITDPNELKDPRVNARAALMLLRGQLGAKGGYQHWSTYNNGLHTPYMESANAGATGAVTMPSEGGGEAYAGPGQYVGRGFKGLGGLYQCAQYARDAGGLSATKNWRPDAKASELNLKPGDWVARFNPDGTYGNQYGYSHTARFEKYVYDNKGNAIGMRVTQQYGRRPVHEGFIPFGNDNKPEFDANNYHRIRDTGGRPRERRSEAESPERGAPKSKVAAVVQHQAPTQLPQPQTADLSAAEFFRRRYAGAERKGEEIKVTSTKGMQKYADAGTTMSDAAPAKSLGHIGAKYEGGRGGVETVSSGRIGRGKKSTIDPGGVSYGSHQLSSTKGTMAEFLKTEGKVFAASFKGLTPGTAKFTKVYKDLTGEGSPWRSEMEKAQQKFIDKTHYEPFIEHARKRGFDTNNPAIQEAVHSLGVQMRNHSIGILDKAKPEPGHSVTQQIQNIYKYRTEFYPKDTRRYRNEQNDVLAYHKETSGPEKAAPAVVAATTPSMELSPTPIAQEPVVTEKKRNPIAEALFPTAKAENTTAAKTDIPGTAAKPLPATKFEPNAPAAIPPATVKPVEDSSSNFLRSQGIPGGATGGSFHIPDGGFKMQPLNVSKGDNMAAVSNKTGAPLFTARGDEAMKYDPSQRKVDVMPSKKVDGGSMGGANKSYGAEFDALRAEFADALKGAGTSPQPQMVKGRSAPSDTPQLLQRAMNDTTHREYHNPAMKRAVERIKFGEKTNDHFGHGNT
jgi:hypothetical protein